MKSMRIAAGFLLVVAAMGGGLWWSCAGVSRTFDARPVPSVLTYQGLLSKYVSAAGSVDYARWHATPVDVQALDAHLARLTASSPDSHPDRFTTPASKLSYWLNLYNALVIREVLRHWPVESVNDIQPSALSFVKQGKGFFYDTLFVVGGKELNLLDVENEIIRARFHDARIHFALNCASASCPVLERGVFVDGELDSQLDKAARAFINDRNNVRVDASNQTLALSKIFEWYAEDFIAHARGKSEREDAGLVDFLMLFADAPLTKALDGARGYELSYLEYDWGINRGVAPTPGSAVADGKGRGVGKSLPDFEVQLLDGKTWKPADFRGKVVLIEFWATYCQPCRESFPKLQELAKQHPEDLVVVAIALDDAPQPVREFMSSVNATFPVALDDGGRVSTRLAVERVPTEILVDRSGVVRHRSSADVSGLKQKVQELL
jgi:thiol-disulfide isomerase/thioredoxin